MVVAISIYFSTNNVSSTILDQPCRLKCIVAKTLQGLSPGQPVRSQSQITFGTHLCNVSQTVAYVLCIHMLAVVRFRMLRAVTILTSGARLHCVQ